MYHFPALPFTFILICTPTSAAAWRVIGWQSADGQHYSPVAACVAEREPGGDDWEIGKANTGAQLLKASEGGTVYHIHAADMRHAWELIDDDYRQHHSA